MATPPAAIPQSDAPPRLRGVGQFAVAAAAAALGVALFAALAAVALAAAILGAVLALAAVLIRRWRRQTGREAPQGPALEARATAEGWVVEAAPSAR